MIPCAAPQSVRRLALASLASATALIAHAQVSTAPVVVTATRVEQPSFDLPLAIDVIEGERMREQRLGVNVSEVLGSVPGTVVQSRETYAQEQQIVIRGFGARSQFGVRGIKLIADGIPASTPDGQGGSGLFDLRSARRIEVLRGPFSALYGNHSGGVVQLFTEDGPERPTLTGDFAAGSYGAWRAGLKFGGQSGGLNYIGSASRFETDGYRDWSGARKDQVNAKLSFRPDAKSSWTFQFNYLNQPDNLDPLGLTAAELARDRRQASPAALDFDTRRSLDNLQGGVVFETALSDVDTLRAIAWLGQRGNEQFLAIPLVTQNGLGHSGGLSTIDRDFGGVGLRWTRRSETLTLTAGADYERAQDVRKGYLNNNGVQGVLKRDEDNTVSQAGAYVQGEWWFARDWSLSAGLRYTRVAFDSQDKFICTTSLVTAPGTAPGLCSGSTLAVDATRFNPDDSGSVTHSAWTPALGLLYRLSPSVNLYANTGRSFETPTFIELAYRPDGGSGLNFELKPSESNHYELGMKAFLGRDLRMNLAVFQIDTRDEIVVFSNSGGRATFQNAGKTRRRGVELAIDGPLGAGFQGYLSATWLDARFQDSFQTCDVIPCTAAQRKTVAAGNRLPGVPNYVVHGELSWRHAPLGFSSAIEGRWNGKVLANDINTVAAERYFVANLRAGFEQRVGGWRFSEFARIDNVLDEEFIGAVYVNEGNLRFFAPAPERSYLIGASAAYRF